jgi:hypothetical protein
MWQLIFICSLIFSPVAGDDQNPEALWELIQINIQKQNFAAAATDLAAFIHQFPASKHSLDAKSLLALSQCEQKLWETCETSILSLLKANPPLELKLANLSRLIDARIEQKHYALAQTSAQEASKILSNLRNTAPFRLEFLKLLDRQIDILIFQDKPQAAQEKLAELRRFALPEEASLIANSTFRSKLLICSQGLPKKSDSAEQELLFIIKPFILCLKEALPLLELTPPSLFLEHVLKTLTNTLDKIKALIQDQKQTSVGQNAQDLKRYFCQKISPELQMIQTFLSGPRFLAWQALDPVRMHVKSLLELTPCDP